MPDAQEVQLERGIAPVVLPWRTRGSIFAYLGAILLLQGMGDPGGGFIGLPVNFILKNKLHLQANQTAIFGVVAYIPVYLAFVFGFARDSFNPFGMRDRGFIMLFGGGCAAIYLLAAFMPISPLMLLGVSVLVGCSFLFVVSAQNGLMSTLAGQHAMSGQASANQNLFISLITVITFLAGGMLSDRLERLDAAHAVRTIYVFGAIVMLIVALFGLWRPRAVFGNVHAEHSPRASLWGEIGRLARHRPLYPAMLIWLLWNFNPGAITPLMYYLQNHFHATDNQWAQYNVVAYTAFLPTYILYGWLCSRVRLKTLLWWSTVIAIPQFVCLAFIHSIAESFIAAAAIGLLGGLATAAYLDLIIRSCPHGLQGTTLMMSAALLNIGQRLGDLLGTWLYDRSGAFITCVIAVTATYALILPALLLVPRALIETADGKVRGVEPSHPGQ